MLILARRTVTLGLALLSVTLPAHSVPLPNRDVEFGGRTSIPSPVSVESKEYSDEQDKNATGIPDSGQVIAWDGAGGVTDTFDFDLGQVDALANINDALSQVISPFFPAPLLFSVRPDVNNAPVLFERPDGGFGIWATSAQVNSDPLLPVNLDGLEVYGPGRGGNQADDANVFSLTGDLGGVSVWTYDGSTSTPWFLQSDIAAALNAAGIPISDETLVDVDALFVSRDFGILFSLWPFNDPLTGSSIVGDEVWFWNGPGDVPVFLNHGGHLWDSGWLGLNVDALEAVVPEPTTLALFGLGLAGLGVARRNKKVAASA